MICAAVLAVGAAACGAEPVASGVSPDTPVSSPVNSASQGPGQPVQAGAAVVTPDACHAGAWQDWVGRLRSELPPRAPRESWRVYQIGDALTEDYSAERLNIEIAPSSQRIVRLWCG